MDKDINLCGVIMDNLQEQIAVVVNIRSQRHGFPQNSITVETARSATSDDYEIRLSYRNCYTAIGLSAYTLRASAAGLKPMIVEYIDEGMARLANEVIRTYGDLHNTMSEISDLHNRIRDMYNTENIRSIEWIPQDNPFVKDDIETKTRKQLQDFRAWIAESGEFDDEIISDLDARIEDIFNKN